MSEQTPEGAAATPAAEIPKAAVAPRRGLSLVWLIPIVAAVIGGWLAFKTITEKGPEISVSFKTAAGLEAGKTKIKYKDVDVGVIETIRISDDLASIVVTASLERGTESYLNANTRFWVVRPRLDASGISGLGTLVSGAYVEVEPGDGEPTRDFVGLEVPPVVTSDVPGKRYTLLARKLGSVGRGSPIYFRGIQVGEVLGHELADNKQDVIIHIFVNAPHDALVHDNTQFWNASGVDVSISADGINVQTESVQSLLAGGVAFETPRGRAGAAPAAEGTKFTLFDNKQSIGEATFTESLRFLLYFDGSVRGLAVGAPVEFRGIKVGSVTDVRLEFDARDASIRLPVEIQIQPQRVDTVGGADARSDIETMEVLVSRGLRAQLRTGSLLTGQLFVELDLHRDAAPAEMRLTGKLPVLPTIPSSLDELRQSVTSIMGKIGKLPLDELVQSVNAAVGDLRALLKTLNSEVKPLTGNLIAASEEATRAMRKAENLLSTADAALADDSPLRHDLAKTLKELSAAARSIRIMADYLERHPDALIRGKRGP